MLWLVTEKNGKRVSRPSVGRYIVKDFICRVIVAKVKQTKQQQQAHKQTKKTQQPKNPQEGMFFQQVFQDEKEKIILKYF